jgi:nitroreductase
MLKDLLRKNRSYRRFDADVAIERSCLEELIALTRLAPSAANLQPLKYLLVYQQEDNDKIFPCLKWAGYLIDWEGPEAGQRPAAYIVILQDREIEKRPSLDHGIAAHTMLLGAAERGLGGCMIGSIAKDDLRAHFAIASRYDILLVVALGKPRETVLLEEATGGNIKYWRDADSVHHVPKRPITEVLFQRT